MAKVFSKPSGSSHSRCHCAYPWRTAGENLCGVFQRFLFQDCGEGGAGVFGVDIDVSGHHRLLCQECSAEIEFAADVSVQAILEVLRDDFAEHELLGEIL